MLDPRFKALPPIFATMSAKNWSAGTIHGLTQPFRAIGMEASCINQVVPIGYEFGRKGGIEMLAIWPVEDAEASFRVSSKTDHVFHWIAARGLISVGNHQLSEGSWVIHAFEKNLDVDLSKGSHLVIVKSELGLWNDLDLADLANRTMSGRLMQNCLLSDFAIRLVHSQDCIPAVGSEFKSVLVTLTKACSRYQYKVQYQKSGEESLDDADEYIQENLFDPNLTAERVAEETGVSRRALDTLFTKWFSTTVNQYIQDERLDAAKTILEEWSEDVQTIDDLAIDLGFKTGSHFSRVYKEKFGFTPRETPKPPPGMLRLPRFTRRQQEKLNEV